MTIVSPVLETAAIWWNVRTGVAGDRNSAKRGNNDKPSAVLDAFFVLMDASGGFSARGAFGGIAARVEATNVWFPEIPQRPAEPGLGTSAATGGQSLRAFFSCPFVCFVGHTSVCC